MQQKRRGREFFCCLLLMLPICRTVQSVRLGLVIGQAASHQEATKKVPYFLVNKIKAFRQFLYFLLPCRLLYCTLCCPLYFMPSEKSNNYIKNPKYTAQQKSFSHGSCPVIADILEFSCHVLAMTAVGSSLHVTSEKENPQYPPHCLSLSCIFSCLPWGGGVEGGGRRTNGNRSNPWLRNP
jgi:hypothetical protein